MVEVAAQFGDSRQAEHGPQRLYEDNDPHRFWRASLVSRGLGTSKALRDVFGKMGLVRDYIVQLSQRSVDKLGTHESLGTSFQPSNRAG